MNTVWSDYIQGIETLYTSRRLRFADCFAPRYRELLPLTAQTRAAILEIGCGPGALAGILHRWYPNAAVTGLDRDSAFIRFAREREPGVAFLEGDAAALPFSDGSFDATISHTVSEHVEPTAFFSEQFRVLKPGGFCIVMSSRKTIRVLPPCLLPNEAENRFWEKVQRYDTSMEDHAVCRYPLTEAELPHTMEQCGFTGVSIGYVTVDLTPDDPKFPPAMALAMIEAGQKRDLEGLNAVQKTLPDRVTKQELDGMRRRINEKYDERVALYRRGEKQWDTETAVIMVLKGGKPS